MLKRINQILFSPLFSIGVLILVALLFTKYYFLLTNEYYPPSFARNIADFQADKVFQKRFLIPFTADILSQFAHLSFDKSLKFLTALSTFGLLYYFNHILNYFTKSLSSSYWCLIILIPISWNYMFINSIYHAYDIPTLFFFCMCLYLFLKRRYVLFYIIFITATFNRESTCFIPVFLILVLFNFETFKDLKKSWLKNFYLTLHLFCQTIIWFIVTIITRWLIEDSPGQSYETTYSMKTFIHNMWNGAQSWPFLNTNKFFGNPRCFLTLFGCIWLAIPFLWKHIPLQSKKALLFLPIYMIPAFMYANLMEARVYHELNVVIALVVTSGIINLKHSKVNCSA